MIIYVSFLMLVVLCVGLIVAQLADAIRQLGHANLSVLLMLRMCMVETQ